MILSGVGLLGLGWIKEIMPGASLVIISALMMLDPHRLMRYAAATLNCTWMIPTNRSKRCPTGPTLKSGLHYLPRWWR